jgi:hypothetical protein
LGDSFAAGHGLCDVEERFSNIMARALDAPFAVINIAHNGWTSADILAYAEVYPISPDVVILSYYFNDIDSAIRTAGGAGRTTLTVPGLHTPDHGQVINDLRNRSFAFNYFYWHVFYKNYHLDDAQQITQVYLDAFDDPAVWDVHHAELQAILDWAAGQGAKVIVVTWPLLGDFSLSAPALTKVEALFEAQYIPVLRTADLFKADQITNLVVSSIDAHPSAYANRKVAEALAEMVRQLGKP